MCVASTENATKLLTITEVSKEITKHTEAIQVFTTDMTMIVDGVHASCYTVDSLHNKAVKLFVKAARNFPDLTIGKVIQAESIIHVHSFKHNVICKLLRLPL